MARGFILLSVLPTLSGARHRRRASLLAAAVLLTAALGASARTIPSVLVAARQHGPAMVRVHPLGKAAPSLGFAVGTRGVIVTVSDAREGQGVVVESANGARVRARVVARDRRTQLSVVEVLPNPDHDAPFPTLLLAADKARVGARDWLLGITLNEDGHAVASLGGLSRLEGERWWVDLPCPAGTPILDRRGRVVAVATASIGSHRVHAVPVAKLRALLLELTRPNPEVSAP